MTHSHRVSLSYQKITSLHKILPLYSSFLSSMYTCHVKGTINKYQGIPRPWVVFSEHFYRRDYIGDNSQSPIFSHSLQSLFNDCACALITSSPPITLRGSRSASRNFFQHTHTTFFHTLKILKFEFTFNNGRSRIRRRLRKIPAFCTRR